MAGSRSLPAAVAQADGSGLAVGGTADGTAERLIPAAPPAPVPPLPAPPQAQPEAAKPGTFAFVAVPKRIKPSRTFAVSVKLRCKGGACRDRLTLKHGRKTVAHRTVTSAAGRTVIVRLKLGASARRALARRSLRVTLELSRPRTKVVTTLQPR
jgi:hypothetical protein